MCNLITCFKRALYAVLLAISLQTSAAETILENGPYYGVNLAGAEFGTRNLPGTFSVDYIYSKHSEVDYYLDKGMNIVRLPFRWERVQLLPNAELNAAELKRINKIVDHATGQGALVILDLHNYARYHGDIVGGAQLSVSAFGDVWRKLALAFKHNPKVVFGLMNEPHLMPTEQWRDAANTAIAAIRDAGASNLILVPGNGYTGAHSWKSNWYGTPNSEVMLTIVDPIDHYAFEVHQYLDENSSGTGEVCISEEVGVKRLAKFTEWLKQNDRKGFLGEFAGADNPTCAEAVENVLSYIDANLDVWIGWTWWAGGPWWGNYPFSIEPKGGQDKPQMGWLEKHLMK